MNDIMKNTSSFIQDQQNQKPCGKDLVLKKKKNEIQAFFIWDVEITEKQQNNFKF